MSNSIKTQKAQGNGKSLADLKAFDTRFANCSFDLMSNEKYEIIDSVRIAHCSPFGLNVNGDNYSLEVAGETVLLFFPCNVRDYKTPRAHENALTKLRNKEEAFASTPQCHELVQIAFDFFTKTEEIALIPVSKAQQARDMAIMNPKMSKYAIAKQLGMYYSAVVAALKGDITTRIKQLNKLGLNGTVMFDEDVDGIVVEYGTKWDHLADSIGEVLKLWEKDQEILTKAGIKFDAEDVDEDTFPWIEL